MSETGKALQKGVDTRPDMIDAIDDCNAGREQQGAAARRKPVYGSAGNCKIRALTEPAVAVPIRTLRAVAQIKGVIVRSNSPSTADSGFLEATVNGG